MDSTSVWAGVIVGALAALFFGTIVLFYPFYTNGYREGQLDYQRGKIKYELTETGYKENVEVKP